MTPAHSKWATGRNSLHMYGGKAVVKTISRMPRYNCVFSTAMRNIDSTIVKMHEANDRHLVHLMGMGQNYVKA